jgi:hypothetical protein
MLHYLVQGGNINVDTVIGLNNIGKVLVGQLPVVGDVVGQPARERLYWDGVKAQFPTWSSLDPGRLQAEAREVPEGLAAPELPALPVEREHHAAADRPVPHRLQAEASGAGVAWASDQSLGTLTVSWLTKFIRQQLEQNPRTHLEQLGVDELTVEKTLLVADGSRSPRTLDFSFVGSQGKPAFAAGWVHYGSPYSNAGYIKRPDGWVELVGVIKNGTVGSAAFTLPPGFRPSSLKSLLTLSNGTTGRVDIGG